MKRADVVIVGGGPAGSTAASLLAAQGADVLVLERDAFPRFRIGESLLPIDLPIFERLGFRPTTDEYVRKAGAIFHDDTNGNRTTFRFAEGLPGTPDHAWQVERAVFDDTLLRLASGAGARVEHGVHVEHVDLEHPDRVRLDTSAGPIEARYLLDATGPRALTGKQKQAIDPIRGFGIAAVFAHWAPIADDIFEELTVAREGHIGVLIEEFGWGWVIPLAGKRLSVGFVTKNKDVGPDLYWKTVEQSSYVKPLVRGATPSEPRMVGNFSFINRLPSGARYHCIGDAAAFLDPVFSSGVSLGMLGAELAADLLGPALAAGEEGDPDLMTGTQARMKHAYESFGSLIHRFYNTKLVDHVFFHPEPDTAVRAGIISVLAADVWRDDNAFQKSILTGRNAWQYQTGSAGQRAS